MTENDWQAVTWGLTNGDCILVLGDEATGPPGRTVRDQLTAALTADLPTAVPPELDFPQIAWLYQSARARADLVRRVAEFHQSRTGPPFEVHRKLATLPFHCVITSSHDRSMERALADAKKPPRTAAYQFRGFSEDLDSAGTPDRPLVYYLFGRVESARSLVLTEHDLVDFLVSVAANTPPIPKALISELSIPDKMFLFLGFGVRHWYPRVLLQVLKMQNRNSRSFALEEFPPPADLGRSVFFYRHGYKVDVFNQDTASFVDELCRRYKPPASGSVSGSPPPSSGSRPTAFLCHAHENAALALDVQKALNDLGLDVWLDQVSLEPGARWNDEIEDRIRQVEYFIVLVTSDLHDRERSYAFKELNVALDEATKLRKGRRFIIPLLVGDAPILDELSHLHQGPVTGGAGEDPLTLTEVTKAEVLSRLASSIKRDRERRLKKGA